jgi:hypothetical protein
MVLNVLANTHNETIVRESPYILDEAMHSTNMVTTLITKRLIHHVLADT